MSIESELYSTLTGDPGVSGLVGNRIYPNVAPENVARPYIAFQVISDVRLSTVTGVGDAKRKLIQLSCHATTANGAKDVADSVESALEGNGYLEVQVDTYDPTTQLHSAIVDWSFME